MNARKARRIRAAIVAVERWLKVTEEMHEIEDGSRMQNIFDMSAQYQIRGIYRMPYGARVLERRLKR